MESPWLLSTPEGASVDYQGTTYPDEFYSTGGPRTTEAPSFYYGRAVGLTLLVVFSFFFICCVIFCWRYRLSRSPPPEPPPNEEFIQMEALDSPQSSPTSLRSHLSLSVGDPQGHLDVPPSTPVVQFHHTYADDVDDVDDVDEEVTMSSPVSHWSVSPYVSPYVSPHVSELSLETEPSLEH